MEADKAISSGRPRHSFTYFTHDERNTYRQPHCPEPGLKKISRISYLAHDYAHRIFLGPTMLSLDYGLCYLGSSKGTSYEIRRAQWTSKVEDLLRRCDFNYVGVIDTLIDEHDMSQEDVGLQSLETLMRRHEVDNRACGQKEP